MRRRLSDWSDALVLLTVAKTGSFGAAAAELGIDKMTVSRRIADLEKRAGTPLFTRRTTGAQATNAGIHLVEAAEDAADAIDNFYRRLRASSETSTMVSVAAPEGLTSYVLTPSLSALPGERTLIPSLSEVADMPALQFLPLGTPADLELLLVSPDEPVPRPGDVHIKRIGRMNFKAVAGAKYLAAFGMPEKIADLGSHRIVNHALYSAHPAFHRWSEVGQRAHITQATSSALHRATVAGGGISLLPDFSPVLDPDVVTLSLGQPLAAVDLWLAAHPDTLRLPSARRAYDNIARVFTACDWFSA